MKNLILYVIGVSPTTGKVLKFDTDKIGSVLSTSTVLDINQINNINGITDWTIIYDEITFNNTDLEMLSDYILSITPKYDSGRNEDVIINTNYLYNKKNKNKFTIKNLKILDDLLSEKIGNIKEEGKVYIDQNGDEFKSGEIYLNDDDDNDYEDLLDIFNIAKSQKNIDIDEDVTINTSLDDVYAPILGNRIKANKEVVNDGYNILNAVRGGSDISYNYDDREPVTQDMSDDEDFDIKSYNKDDYDDNWGYSVSSSKVLEKSVNTKHNIKKYSMIFVKNKKSVLKDYKTIKKFLKEFLPGNSKYMKEYRKDVAARWIFSLVRTYKQVKKMEKEQQEEEENANNNKFKKSLNKIAKAFIPILKS